MNPGREARSGYTSDSERRQEEPPTGAGPAQQSRDALQRLSGQGFDALADRKKKTVILVWDNGPVFAMRQARLVTVCATF